MLTAFVLVTMTMFKDADFTGKPSVLLVGQYSTGKTTLIRFCDNQDDEDDDSHDGEMRSCDVIMIVMTMALV